MAMTATRSRLTSEELLRLLELDLTRPATKGALEALRRQTTDPSQRAVIDALAALPVQRSVAYVSPTDRARAQAGVQFEPGTNPESGGRRRTLLSAADLEWLRRLPSTPEDVSDDDARVLARLAEQVDPKSGDARLLESILRPVRHLHDRRELETALKDLKARRPAPLGIDFTNLLADALASELDLSWDEALSVAHVRVAEGEAARRSGHDERVAAVEADLAELENPTPIPADA